MELCVEFKNKFQRKTALIIIIYFTLKTLINMVYNYIFDVFFLIYYYGIKIKISSF